MCIVGTLPWGRCDTLIPVLRSRCNLSVSALKGLLSSSSIWNVCPLRMISSSVWYGSVWCSCLFVPVLELSRSTERTDNFTTAEERRKRIERFYYGTSISLTQNVNGHYLPFPLSLHLLALAHQGLE